MLTAAEEDDAFVVEEEEEEGFFRIGRRFREAEAEAVSKRSFSSALRLKK